MEADSPFEELRLGFITSQWAESSHIFNHYEPTLPSTNDLAKTKAFAPELAKEHLALFLADHQSAGRGRGKNTWIDAQAGRALLSSWSYSVAEKPQPTASCLVGLAVYRALATTWPFLEWSLKAPNDIYLADKKAAGLLLESVQEGEKVRLIVGLGLNVLGSPKEVPTAGSLLGALSEETPLLGLDWIAFLDRLLFELTDAVTRSEEPLTTTDRQSLLTMLNRFPGLAEKYIDMDAHGSLRFASGKTLNWWEL